MSLLVLMGKSYGFVCFLTPIMFDTKFMCTLSPVRHKAIMLIFPDVLSEDQVRMLLVFSMTIDNV